MAGFLLTDDERRRFAEWCERNADTAFGMAAQMDKLGGPVALLAQKERNEAMAYRIVARILRATESMTIGPREGQETCDE